MIPGYESLASAVDHYRLGEILEKADFISGAALARIAGLPNVGVRLGQRLILGGLISHNELQASLQVQSLLRESVVDEPLAIRALQLTRSRDISLDQALELLKAYECTSNVSNNRLGQLLVEAAVVTTSELEDGLLMAKATGLPLGKIFVLAGILKENDLTALVHIQIMLRQNAMERSAALAQIASLGSDDGNRKCPDSTPKSNARVRTAPPAQVLTQLITAEDLLVRSGVISETHFVMSIQECAISGQRPEDVLISKNVIDVQTALFVATMVDEVNSGKIELGEASRRVAQLSNNTKTGNAQNGQSKHSTPNVEWTIEPPAALPQVYPQNLVDFLVLCNILNSEQCQSARRMRAGTKLDELEVLVRINSLSRTDVDVAAVCFQSMKDSIVTLDEAIFTNSIFSKAVYAGALTVSDLRTALANKAQFQAIAKQLNSLAKPAPLSCPSNWQSEVKAS